MTGTGQQNQVVPPPPATVARLGWRPICVTIILGCALGFTFSLWSNPDVFPLSRSRSTYWIIVDSETKVRTRTNGTVRIQDDDSMGNIVPEANIRFFPFNSDVPITLRFTNNKYNWFHSCSGAVSFMNEAEETITGVEIRQYYKQEGCMEAHYGMLKLMKTKDGSAFMIDVFIRGSTGSQPQWKLIDKYMEELQAGVRSNRQGYGRIRPPWQDLLERYRSRRSLT
jgi:hypothetical protein